MNLGISKAAHFAAISLLTCSEVSARETAEEESDHPEIVVIARAAELYRVEETESGKLPTEPLASSQTITVITEDLIKDQGARNAQDLYRNISGVSVYSYAGVTARGFSQGEIFFDGLRGDPYIGFTVPQLFNIKRVEFLKGPAGMLYGQTAPGGLFNYVTKKPEQEFKGSLAIAAGTENRYGAQAEINAPLTNAIAVRGGLFFEDRDLPRRNAGSKVLLGDIGATLDLDDAKFTAQLFRNEQDLDGNRLRGVPVDNDGHFLTSRRWNHNEPGDFLDLRSTSAQFRAEIEPVDNVKFDAMLRRIDATEIQKYHEPIGLPVANAESIVVVPRQYRDQKRKSGMWSFGANAIWSLQLGDRISNRLLAGFDYSKSQLVFDGRSLTGRTTDIAGLPCPIFLLNPVYGRCTPETYNLPAFNHTITNEKRRGIYLLTELTIGNVIAVGGVRTDRFEDSNTTRTFSDSDETYRIGLVWRVRKDISLFGQYATSFEPQGIGVQDPRAGGPFMPTSGAILEGGVKTALLNGRIQSSLSAYRIVRKNILQADPRGDPEGDGINNQVAFGEVVSKGFDFDLATDITTDWVLTLVYAYNDTRITKDNGQTVLNASVPGGRFANAPRHQLGFWTRYQFPERGLALAIGGDYMSERRGISNQRVRPYFVFDGSATWKRGPWNILLRIDNIFDKTYAASGYIDRTGHFPGKPRSAFAEIGYSF